MSTASFEKGVQALRLYRRIMQLHMRNMPQELRLFGKPRLNEGVGDLYVKQEFRLHLDKASNDQMDKFLVGWEEYAGQIEKVDHKKGPKHVKQVLTSDTNFDQQFKEKFTEEQHQTLGEFRNLIFETEQRKKTP